MARRCPACRRREPDLLLSYGTWEGVPRQLSFVPVRADDDRECPERLKPLGVEYLSGVC